jgi:transposase, IS30 family
MKKYTQLTIGLRYQIRAMLNVDYTQSAIAIELNVSKSTISRELKRNIGLGHYSPIQADNAAIARRRQCKSAQKFTDADWQIVEACLHERFSPEQTAHRLALTKQLKISHQTIYTHVYQDKASGGVLSDLLRAKKTYRKRYKGGAKKRDIIKNRVSIELRPAIVEEKSRIGDFEADTVMGKNHQGAIVTLVDRYSRYTFARALHTKRAKGVTTAIKALLKPHIDRCHTITFDNGTEFAGHGKIAKALDLETFFAHPYSSWERGANENTNGLLREYYPKGISLRGTDNAELQQAVDQMNHRPRKCLGYRTPYEVFFNQPSSWNNPLLDVALRT